MKYTGGISLLSLLLSSKASAQNTNADIDYAEVFDHVCERDSMYAYIKGKELAKLGSWKSNFTSLTLNSQQCGATRQKNDKIMFYAGSFKDEPLECDTQYTSNYGTVTFWNMVQFTPQDDSVITRDTEGLYNFSCTYNMTVTGQSFELSLGHKVKTSSVDTIRFAGREGKGNFSASMELFRDETFDNKASYKDTYGVTLNLEEYLFIETRLNASDKDITLKILECWATPSVNAGNQIRHTLIQDGCKADETVKILRSGLDQVARWKTQMFTFINEDEVWLHCDVQACDRRQGDCTTDCTESGAPFSVVATGERQKRSLDNVIRVTMRKKRTTEDIISKGQMYEPNILTVGPIVNGEREKIAKQKQVGPIVAITVIGVIIGAAMFFGIYRVLVLKRSEEEKIIEANTNNQVTADWQLYSSNQAEDGVRKNPMLVY